MNALPTKGGGGVPLNARPLVFYAGKHGSNPYLIPDLCQGVRG